MLNILHVKPNFYQTDSSITKGIFSSFATEDTGKKDLIPESTRSDQCSKKKGTVFYEQYGNANHRRRFQYELTPSEWHTTLLFHKILLPFTEEEYCSLLDYFVRREGEENAQSNLLIKGHTFINFSALQHANMTFQTGIMPLFLWRYNNRFLYEMEIDISLEEDSVNFDLEFGNLNYTINEYFTVRFGKFILPLGFWNEKMDPEWINRLPTPPLPYTEPMLIPPSDLGIDFRGAVPLSKCHDPLIPAMVFTYDIWIGNGPREKDGEISFEGNYTDNNNNKAIGARLSFRPKPYRSIGISGMSAQWNDNSESKKLYYHACVLEWDWHFNDYSRFLGEFLFTQRNELSQNIIETGLWAQYCQSLGLTNISVLRNFEILFRYGLITSDINSHRRSQYTFGIDYYLSNKMIIKAGYDVNFGPENSANLFTMQWAYGF